MSDVQTFIASSGSTCMARFAKLNRCLKLGMAKAPLNVALWVRPAILRSSSTQFATCADLWRALTPLGRNEFICWVDDAKQIATRQRRIARTCEELLEGKKRPCCWAGCIHRTDKAPSRWQQAVLLDRKSKISPAR